MVFVSFALQGYFGENVMQVSEHLLFMVLFS